MVYALKLKKHPPEFIKQRLDHVAGILGLEPFLDRYPRQLSGGQRQRVAMGRAIVRDPQVFLFDEPLSNLDAKLRVQMRKEIKELHQRLKTTTIFVTHDQVEAMTMADKIVVMQSGIVQQIGAPLDLYDNPNNTFVATFIGSPSMNIIEGTYEKKTNSIITKLGDVQQLPEVPAVFRWSADKNGHRPEHLDLSDNGLKVTVSVVEPTGPETMAFFKYGDGEIVTMFHDRHDLHPGQKVFLRPRAEKILLFNVESGKQIGGVGPKTAN